jgi:hypothetical protein
MTAREYVDSDPNQNIEAEAQFEERSQVRLGLGFRTRRHGREDAGRSGSMRQSRCFARQPVP